MSAHSVLPALRQAPGTPTPTPATGPAGDGTSEGSGESTLIPFIIVAVVVAVLAATIFLFVLVRILIARRSGRFAAEHVDVAPRGESSRDHIVYAYFPAQAPAVVRMQRLAQSAGLTLQELSEVSPVIPFKRKAGGEEENTCAVCLEEMDADAKTRRMPCGHDFHAKYVVPCYIQTRSLASSALMLTRVARWPRPPALRSQMHRRVGIESQPMSRVQHADRGRRTTAAKANGGLRGAPGGCADDRRPAPAPAAGTRREWDIPAARLVSGARGSARSGRRRRGGRAGAVGGGAGGRPAAAGAAAAERGALRRGARRDPAPGAGARRDARAFP